MTVAQPDDEDDIRRAETRYDAFLATTADGDDRYSGDGGQDTYSLAGTTAGATVNFITGAASSSSTGLDTLNSIENVIGSAGNDRISNQLNVLPVASPVTPSCSLLLARPAPAPRATRSAISLRATTSTSAELMPTAIKPAILYSSSSAR